MNNPIPAGINEFIAAILFGDLPLCPAITTVGEDPFMEFRKLIDLNKAPNQSEFSRVFNELLLRIDPDLISRLCKEKWASEYAVQIAGLLAIGSEDGFDVAPEPPSTDNEPPKEVVDGLMNHIHWQDLSAAAATGDVAKLRNVFDNDAEDFCAWLADMLQSAIEAGQLVSVQCLFEIAHSEEKTLNVDFQRYLEFALELAATRQQESILKWLLEQDEIDLTQFDAAFWRNCFPNGTSDDTLRDSLIDRIPVYGSALLLKATTAEDWKLARTISDRLNVVERKDKAYESLQSLAFLEHLSRTTKGPRDKGVINRIVGEWLHIIAGHSLKVHALNSNISSVRNHQYKDMLTEAYKHMYKTTKPFGPIEARRVWEALRDHPVFEEHIDQWNELNDHPDQFPSKDSTALNFPT